MEWWWLGYLAVGAVVGLFAGMLGIGGGTISVPLLVMLFNAQGMPKSVVVHLAVGTTMASILFTSVSNVRAHARRGVLRWDIAYSVTPGILAGGLFGSMLASLFSTDGFALFFTAFVFLAATNMLVDGKPSASRDLPGAAGMVAAGVVVGAISSLAAIGGAVLTVPMMLYCNVPVLQAIGTAAMIGFPIALAGSIGFMLAGMSVQALPAHSVGYIYLPALAGLAAASMLLAPVGAALAYRMPTRRLKQVFAVLLLALAGRMLVTLWQ